MVSCAACPHIYAPLISLLPLQSLESVVSVTWFAQLKGVYQIKLTPIELCEEECQPVIAVLQPGELCEYLLWLAVISTRPLGTKSFVQNWAIPLYIIYHTLGHSSSFLPPC